MQFTSCTCFHSLVRARNLGTCLSFPGFTIQSSKLFFPRTSPHFLHPIPPPSLSIFGVFLPQDVRNDSYRLVWPSCAMQSRADSCNPRAGAYRKSILPTSHYTSITFLFRCGLMKTARSAINGPPCGTVSSSFSSIVIAIPWCL